LEQDLDERKTTELDYDEEMSIAINAQERLQANGAALSGLMVNADFDQSYIITAT